MGGACIAGFCVLALMPVASGQSARVLRDIARDKAKYASADSPVTRAKALTKLGKNEYAAARQALDEGKQDAALQYLRDYSAQAASAHDELAKTVTDPEKHSNGFRQLQISVRERAQELRFLTTRVAFEQRGPFEELQKGLDALNQKLILELFPRQPGHKKKQKEKNP